MRKLLNRYCSGPKSCISLNLVTWYQLQTLTSHDQFLSFFWKCHILAFKASVVLMYCFPCSGRRGRVYLPQDELAQAGLSDEDIFAGRVTDKWRIFMKKQIQRARKFFDEAEKGVTELSAASRFPVSIHKLLLIWIWFVFALDDYIACVEYFSVDEIVINDFYRVPCYLLPNVR